MLIVISDGGDNASAATLVSVVRARNSNAAIYTIGVFEEGDLDRNPGVLKSASEHHRAERFLPRSPGQLPAGVRN